MVERFNRRREVIDAGHLPSRIEGIARPEELPQPVVGCAARLVAEAGIGEVADDRVQVEAVGLAVLW